jgi:hypothetical protein
MADTGTNLREVQLACRPAPMGAVCRADLARMVQRCHEVPPAQRSVWHNAVITLWEHVEYLESKTR